MEYRTPTLAFRICTTILALLILGPSLCSARCSSQLCAPALSQSTEDGCHHASLPDNSDGMKASSGKERCAVAEIVSISPRSTNSDIFDTTSAISWSTGSVPTLATYHPSCGIDSPRHPPSPPSSGLAPLRL